MCMALVTVGIIWISCRFLQKKRWRSCFKKILSEYKLMWVMVLFLFEQKLKAGRSRTTSLFVAKPLISKYYLNIVIVNTPKHIIWRGTPSPVAVGEMQHQNNLIYQCQLQSIVDASVHDGFRWGGKLSSAGWGSSRSVMCRMAFPSDSSGDLGEETLCSCFCVENRMTCRWRLFAGILSCKKTNNSLKITLKKINFHFFLFL